MTVRLAVIPENRKRAPAANAPRENPRVLPFTPLGELEHLLKVAGSVARDGNKAWAAIWSELKHCATPGGMIVAEAKDGFVPSCGWPEFLEKFWELKHYLDSIERICSKDH